MTYNAKVHRIVKLDVKYL